MDNIEALSPKPDEFVENKNSRHPKGLWVLFGPEMWERFNFYGMRALLTLFMVNSLLIKEADAAIIYGGFLALCYLTPLLGGFIADKYIARFLYIHWRITIQTRQGILTRALLQYYFFSSF